MYRKLITARDLFDALTDPHGAWVEVATPWGTYLGILRSVTRDGTDGRSFALGILDAADFLHTVHFTANGEA